MVGGLSLRKEFSPKAQKRVVNRILEAAMALEPGVHVSIRPFDGLVILVVVFVLLCEGGSDSSGMLPAAAFVCSSLGGHGKL